jgi:hypothetical protein
MPTVGGATCLKFEHLINILRICSAELDCYICDVSVDNRAGFVKLGWVEFL